MQSTRQERSTRSAAGRSSLRGFVARSSPSRRFARRDNGCCRKSAIEDCDPAPAAASWLRTASAYGRSRMALRICAVRWRWSSAAALKASTFSARSERSRSPSASVRSWKRMFSLRGRGLSTTSCPTNRTVSESCGANGRAAAKRMTVSRVREVVVSSGSMLTILKSALHHTVGAMRPSSFHRRSFRPRVRTPMPSARAERSRWPR